jgi:hypothetical protein
MLHVISSTLTYFPHIRLSQVLGNAKGTVAVVVSILVFRNPVNVFTVLGYAITVSGVIMYSQVSQGAGGWAEYWFCWKSCILADTASLER